MQEVPKLQEPGRGWMELSRLVTGTTAGIAAADNNKAATCNTTAALATTVATERDAASIAGIVATAGRPAAGVATTKAATGRATAAAG